MGQKVTGIFTPNMVPFDETGRINENELRRLIDYLIEKGVTGLYPNGSTGEFTRLELPERRRVIEIAMERANRAGRPVPVLAGAAEANLDLTIDTMNYYADLGCRAGALIAPYYFPMSQDSIKAYFEELADRSRLDVILYNIPQFANGIAIPTIVALCQHPRIIGIKDSQRDLPRYMNTIAKVRPLRPEFSFLIGCEEILLASLLMGGDGGTIATSGVVPEMIMKLYNLFLAGRIDEATRIQYQMLELIEVMLTGGDFPEGFRAGMTVRGFKMGNGRNHKSAASLLNRSKITETVQCLLAEHGLAAPGAACPVRNPGLSALFPGTPVKGGFTNTAAAVPTIDDAAVKAIVASVLAQLGR